MAGTARRTDPELWETVKAEVTAGEKGGLLTTRPVVLEVDALTLNVAAIGGEVRAQVCDEQNQPIQGFSFADCTPIKADSLAAPIGWKRKLGAGA